MKGARGGNGTYGVNEGGTRGQWMKHKGWNEGDASRLHGWGAAFGRIGRAGRTLRSRKTKRQEPCKGPPLQLKGLAPEALLNQYKRRLAANSPTAAWDWFAENLERGWWKNLTRTNIHSKHQLPMILLEQGGCLLGVLS